MEILSQGGQNSGKQALLATETRPCSECMQYDRPLMGFPLCKKKLMGVTSDMLVTYKVEEGSCFEPREERQ